MKAIRRSIEIKKYFNKLKDVQMDAIITAAKLVNKDIFEAAP